ncbi:TetR/AcrR family transcriptional regulator [Polyangium sp. y55x31]|uniref:TetR/AcrR family transcriptional regulator n=1 Tax=Polyangium sp. y55x31 TaxID=3042688 RepID=UPI0024828FF0|nr:TetR/AcrR family transcriptional regulator [Polyangium sp. y55x31]MDI1482918.1 TetR/AcrR family transcriptional regulator [Polyangium sp. y55x31]
MPLSAESEATFTRILDEAEALFATRGYRRTRLSEVAAAVGVSEPALYRYFRGKDALFEQVLRRAAASPGPYEPPQNLPVPNPEPGQIESFLRAFFEESRRVAALERALLGPAPRTTEEARTELAGVVGELFDLATRYRAGARIMNASALESPELGRIWDENVRGYLTRAVERYLGQRSDEGKLALPTDPIDAAVVVASLVTSHAVHAVELGLPGSVEHRRGVVVASVVAMLEPRKVIR